MRRLCVLAFLWLFAAAYAYADTEDTVVFRTRMLPGNEVPPVAAAGNSASAAITVRVTRDDRGNVNAATVIFDVDYTITSALTFTGLHLHNAPTAQNGPVVIDSGISATSTVVAAAGAARITRVVNYAGTDTTPLRFVTGLLATPENYYVNIHTVANPGGFMRGQLQSSRLVFRPVMSTVFENPPVNLDAEGAALVEVQVNRDAATGAITSGTVIFDVDYRFPSPVTITGLHIHNGPIGVNAPVVIDTGTNAASTAVANVTRGNIFRVVDIPSTNATGIAALNGLFTDPAQYYINLHTTVNPGGAIRGQLSRNVYVFFNQMTQAEENPPTGASGTANSMTYVRIDRDSTGNATGGAVSFNVNYAMGSQTTFTGLHIHNGKIGVNGPVVISSGLSGTNSVVTIPEGFGSINREVSIGATETAFDFLRGLVENPENYYVNIHSTAFPGGVVRAQLVKETYHFKTNMSTANEVPPTTGDTAATGWVTAKVSRDANGNLNGGSVTFDVNYTNSGPMTFTGLHIHYPGVAGVNAGVVINTGLSGTNTVETTTGNGNITRVVAIDPSNAAQMAALTALINAPDTAYINLHTTTFPGGVVRSQMFPVVNTLPLAAGGGEWTSAFTIRNPSTTAAVQGTVDVFNSTGALMPAAVTDPNIAFLIPAGGTTTINTHNKGAFNLGFAKVFSNGAVTIEARYFHPVYTTGAAGAASVTSRSVSLPVAVGTTALANTGIAVLASAAGTLTLSLRDGAGNTIAGGSRTIDVTANQEVVAFVKELLPSVTATSFAGTLTITASSGTISVLALQFDGTINPVTITALP